MLTSLWQCQQMAPAHNINQSVSCVWVKLIVENKDTHEAHTDKYGKQTMN